MPTSVFVPRAVLYLILCSIYRYITDILMIFYDFSFNRLSFTDIVSGRPDTKNVDDILTIHRDIYILGVH